MSLVCCLQQTVCRLSCASSLEKASFWDGQPCRPIWCSVRRMVWALTGWPPHPFNLCSNAGSTHKSISQTQLLDMTLSTCTQLLWSTMARPVLSGTCPVKLLYGLGHRAAAQFQGSWQSSYSLRHLYVEQQFFFSYPQRVLCHEVPCWTSSDQYESVRAITNLTHLLPIPIWDLVTPTSHMTPGREMANWAQFGHFHLGVYSLLWPAV